MRTNMIALLATLAVVGCGTTLKTEGPKKVDNLVGTIEQVYVESELCREKSAVAMDRLQVIQRARLVVETPEAPATSTLRGRPNPASSGSGACSVCRSRVVAGPHANSGPVMGPAFGL